MILYENINAKRPTSTIHTAELLTLSDCLPGDERWTLNVCIQMNSMCFLMSHCFRKYKQLTVCITNGCTLILNVHIFSFVSSKLCCLQQINNENLTPFPRIVWTLMEEMYQFWNFALSFVRCDANEIVMSNVTTFLCVLRVKLHAIYLILWWNAVSSSSHRNIALSRISFDIFVRAKRLTFGRGSN